MTSAIFCMNLLGLLLLPSTPFNILSFLLYLFYWTIPFVYLLFPSKGEKVPLTTPVPTPVEDKRITAEEYFKTHDK